MTSLIDKQNNIIESDYAKFDELRINYLRVKVKLILKI